MMQRKDFPPRCELTIHTCLLQTPLLFLDPKQSRSVHHQHVRPRSYARLPPPRLYNVQLFLGTVARHSGDIPK